MKCCNYVFKELFESYGLVGFMSKVRIKLGYFSQTLKKISIQRQLNKQQTANTQSGAVSSGREQRLATVREQLIKLSTVLTHSSTPAGLEVDRMNGCRDRQRTVRVIERGFSAFCKMMHNFQWFTGSIDCFFFSFLWSHHSCIRCLRDPFLF